MKVYRVWITNYKYFRSIIEDDATAKFVLDNLYKEVEAQISPLVSSHLDLSLSAAYDDEGFCLFDVREFKRLKDDSVIVNVEFTCTAK